MSANDERNMIAESVNEITRSIGFSVIRPFIKHFVELSNCMAKEELLDMLEDQLKDKEDLKDIVVSFINQQTQEPMKFIIKIQECNYNHSLDNELNKIKPFILENKWGDVLKTIELVFNIARKTYVVFMEQHTKLIRDILNEEPQDIHKQLLVDKTNTTLLLPICTNHTEKPCRMGIFIQIV